MYGQTARDLDSGNWANLNPNLCPCKGSGWLHSDLDSFHACPVHKTASQRHPEDQFDGEWTAEIEAAIDAEFAQIAAERLTLNRNLFERFTEIARKAGFKGNFKAACEEVLGDYEEGSAPGPLAWLDAADKVSEAVAKEARETEARAQGYSCDLEARFADYARIERQEAAQGAW